MRRLTARANARDLVLQVLLGVAIAGVVAFFWFNAADNLARRSITFGFGFLWQTAGFDMPFRLVEWRVTDTYGRALFVSFLNTLLVSAMGIIAATLLGLALGIMRLSRNWLVRNTALGVTELVRNTPQLVQIVFWYVAVLQALPGVRNSLELGLGVLLNIRGLYVPSPNLSPGGEYAAAALILAALAAPFLWGLRPAGRRIGWRALLPVAAALVWFALSVDGFDQPRLQGFNIRGGVVVAPELVALWLGLSIYSGVFIAEIVRASIEGVPRGQHEAGRSLALTPGQLLWLVILPQAVRIMIPPTTSQYLNLIKSSSLGAAIAYPEIVQIFAGTVLNQSGRAIEVMFIVMGLFLAINLVTSAFMNWYNRRVALVER